MDSTLTDFIQALRNAEVNVSPAETLLAAEVWHHVGITDRTLLRNALALTLAKSARDKARYAVCFEQFFSLRNQPGEVGADLLSRINRTQLSAILHQYELSALAAWMQMPVAQATQALRIELYQRGMQAGVQQMANLRDKTLVIYQMRKLLGVEQLTGLQASLTGDMAVAADYLRRHLEVQIKAHVSIQYELRVNPHSRGSVGHALAESSLAALSPLYLAEMQQAVDALAEQLRHKCQRRRKVSQRGELHVAAMLRANMAYGGHLFRLRWRHRQRQPTRLFIVCDVSGSLASLSRFFLLLINRLHDTLPAVRSFAFSSQLGEITTQLNKQVRLAGAVAAIERILQEWGGGTTDYGSAFLQFRDLAGAQLDKRATLLILGDARNNQLPANSHMLKLMSQRCRQIIWFTPESKSRWADGDSEMLQYRSYCRQVHRLTNLQDLRKAVDVLAAL